MRSVPWRLQLASVLLLVSGIGSCDDGAGLALRVDLDADLSGSITVSRLADTTDPGAVEGASRAVNWTRRARLECSTGTFENLDGLAVGDVTFAYEAAGSMARLTVTLPRGAAARWPSLLTIPDVEARKQATRLVDTEDLLGDPGGRIALRLQLPADVRASGVRPLSDTLETTIDGARADLIVPVKMAAIEGEPIVWTLTWDV